MLQHGNAEMKTWPPLDQNGLPLHFRQMYAKRCWCLLTGGVAYTHRTLVFRVRIRRRRIGIRLPPHPLP
jgi:hypothetical protein